MLSLSAKRRKIVENLKRETIKTLFFIFFETAKSSLMTDTIERFFFRGDCGENKKNQNKLKTMRILRIYNSNGRTSGKYFIFQYNLDVRICENCVYST